MCLAPLSAEDVEDVYIFGFVMTGLLIIGLIVGLNFWKIRLTADRNDIQTLLVFANDRIKAAGDWNDELKLMILWGGLTKPHSDAQEDSWKKILSFLQQHLCSSLNAKL